MTDETSTRTSRVAGDCAPLVSVIVPHYSDLANLKRCIDLLAAQTVPRSQFEIVVADNNSSCGLNEVADVCGAFARVVSAPVQGAGPARNAAIAASLGDILAFTDLDCRPARDWLERGWPPSQMSTQILWAAASKSMLVTRRIRPPSRRSKLSLRSISSDASNG